MLSLGVIIDYSMLRLNYRLVHRRKIHKNEKGFCQFSKENATIIVRIWLKTRRAGEETKFTRVKNLVNWLALGQSEPSI